VHSRENYKLKQIEKVSKATLKKMDIPSGSDVCRKQFFHFMTNLAQTTEDEGTYNEYLPDIMPLFADLSKEDILKKIASQEFTHFMKYYEDAEDLNVRNKSKSFQDSDNFGNKKGGRNDRRGAGRFTNDSGYTSLFVTLGAKDGLYKAAFLQYILDESRLKKDVLGKINLRDTFTTFEIDTDHAQKMINALEGKSFNGREVFVRYDNQSGGGGNRSSNSRTGGKSSRNGGNHSFRDSARKSPNASKKFYHNGDFKRKEF
jgi:ATP-dependent RNA helicase DeaD